MTYDNIVHGIFLRRLNRFVCEVQVNGEVFPAHVRNTGRCTGVIAAGAEVSLQRSTDSSRKTPFTLIAVSTPQYGWVNIDSLAPNVMAGEWLSKQGFELIHPEHEFGESRIDFYMERSGERYVMEVKGCTLENEGVCKFPDAPTERGVKHLHELIKACESGYEAYIFFVIQMEKAEYFTPNRETHPEFADALKTASERGVKILAYTCKVSPEEMVIDKPCKVIL